MVAKSKGTSRSATAQPVPTLAEWLLKGRMDDATAHDIARLIERQVSAMSGLRGVAIKTGLAVLRAAKPDIVERAVKRMLPEFLRALEPLWQQHLANGGSDFGAYLMEHREAVVTQLLAVADTRVAQAHNQNAKALYKRIRPGAHAEIEKALPQLIRIFAKRPSH